MAQITFEHTLPLALKEAVNLYLRAARSGRLTAPWQQMLLVDEKPGNFYHFTLKEGLLRCKVELRIENPSSTRVVIVQHKGPFASFEQSAEFTARDGHTLVHEKVTYSLRFGPLGHLVNWLEMRPQLKKAYPQRMARLINDIRHLPVGENKPMRILVSGATGTVGSYLVPLLRTLGHDVWTLSRAAEEAPGTIPWLPDEGQVALQPLEGFDAMVHLAGANIAAHRWTAKRKKYLLANRSMAASTLCKAVSLLKQKPHTVILASAVGYYGDTKNQLVNENSPAGSSFSTTLCQAIEGAAAAIASPDVRIVKARFGLVLSPHGGALARLLPAFRWGLGGRVGNGRQYISWIGADDLAYALHHTLYAPRMKGPVNMVAPVAVPQKRFAHTLGRVLHRPALIPMPAFMVRKLFGQMGEELLLASTRVEPAKLTASGFLFTTPVLDEALRHTLGLPHNA